MNTKKQQTIPLLLNQSQLCKHIGVSRRIVLKDVIPRLKPVLLGKTLYYKTEDVKALLDTLAEEQRLEYSKHAG